MRHKNMNCTLLLLAGSLMAIAVAAIVADAFEQDNDKRIGEIEFYGYGGIDVLKVREALPLHEGDEFPASSEANLEVIERLKETIEKTLGYEPTDVQAVCCDERGNGMIYIGLPGKTNKSITYRRAPLGRLRLPAKILDLYEQSLDALTEAVSQGSSEDDSKGYALSHDPTLRAKQLAIRTYAIHHEHQVRRVLKLSADVQQRTVAAHVLGYAQQSKEQITDLVRASRDANEGVRNNAVRALIVLAESNPKVAPFIPPSKFIEMLSSGFWTDRNKASSLLSVLSKGRAPTLLAQLRAQALLPLIEMARWRSQGHAYSAQLMLGRIAGIEETHLLHLLRDRQVEAIIKAL
jgi:hypothetical protein